MKPVSDIDEARAAVLREASSDLLIGPRELRRRAEERTGLRHIVIDIAFWDLLNAGKLELSDDLFWVRKAKT